VLSDDLFKVNAPPTIESRKSFENYLSGAVKKNSDTLNEFTQKLSASLKGTSNNSINDKEF